MIFKPKTNTGTYLFRNLNTAHFNQIRKIAGKNGSDKEKWMRLYTGSGLSDVI